MAGFRGKKPISRMTSRPPSPKAPTVNPGLSSRRPMTPPAKDRNADNPQRRVLYGRRKGRRLRVAQAGLVEHLLPRIEIPYDPEGGTLVPETLFGFAPVDIWLEIGFGAGEHLLAQAQSHPETGFIGCEPYLNGVVKLLGGVDRSGLGNIRIFRDDARLIFGRLPDSCLGRGFVLFPDPWPKTRHHKRRIVSHRVVEAFARTLKPGAELRIATDDPGYLAWILRHVLRNGKFEWLARRPADWRARPDDWPRTRYEAKALAAGRRCAYLRFIRRPDGDSD